VTSVGGLVLLALIDLRLLVVFAVGVPFAWLLARFFVSGTATATHRYQQVQGRLSARFVDAMTGVRTIGASGTVEAEVSRVLAPLPEIRRTGFAMWQLQRTAGWRLAVLGPVLQVAVLSVAGYGVTQGTVSPGRLLAASGYLVLALGLLSQVALLAEIGRARGSAARVAEILDDVPAPSGTGRLPPGPGRVTLRGVTVRVAGRVVLDGLDLDIPPAATVAVVGRSGTGKSTLAAVAGGLLTPDCGDVLLDGRRLADTAPAAVRAAVSYAFARPTLLGATVADALAYADRPIDRSAVVRAADACHARGFVTRLPDGFDTPLSGLRLSGGELQRLGLARATCRDCRLVILDDALSSLDVATEARVSAALDAAFTGRTRLVVTHRVGTAARADLVAWLDGGRIRALDAHDRLWRLPEYRAAFGAAADQPPKTAAEVVA
ncbi:MAG TPA: ABC transporter ATP-binding protein, partial [Nonomuraea sp.]|nr:ABC transporter ATP-binding protein [Nonomuraea sp.]